MIYLVLKHMKIKNEYKEAFLKQIIEWQKVAKKEELNLSIDASWKDENNLVIVERWSSAKAFDKYVTTEEYKQMWNNILPLLDAKPLVLKYETLI
ncbi:hypothetical protein MCSF7_02346 [Mycoplasmopsis columbina SF7]|uniref:ABM domain-containing protein n=1 Tax=Mycoplasmopsis columbina SF7 TaxID=1037410 RepID=F9UKQ6_9BACT|nr:antibiotic biosynthesis monooxygenase [Mycoplasmopsis columbina]EGV00261.1 hypothetical protein MCSF7_02346 [Mycoplasmopsis columbina SF7]